MEGRQAPRRSAAGGAARAVDFLEMARGLKTTPRTGWVHRGVRGPESVADHSWRVALMALVGAEGTSGLDTARAVQIALVHDLAEAIVGDIAPGDGVPAEEKHRREAAAMEQLRGVLGGCAGERVRALWDEYEAGASQEARFVKDMDKLEMILQAREYEEEQGMDLSEFFDSTRGKFKTELGSRWAAEIAERRPGRGSPAARAGSEGAPKGP